VIESLSDINPFGQNDMPCIARDETAHFHAHMTPGRREARLAEEADLRRNRGTVCNEQWLSWRPVCRAL